MGSISLEKVQKLLHLDAVYPYFDNYEQVLEFFVDGVRVRAVALVKWRSIQIDIIEPFQIDGWSFFPPPFAIEYMSVHRQEVLKSRGISEIEDFTEKAKIAYQRHVTYLKLKQQIDRAQDEFLSVFREDIKRLEMINGTVSARVAIEKSLLRKRLKSNEIGQKEYQIALQQLTKEAFEASYNLTDLTRQVGIELETIKNQMIDGALSAKAMSA